MYPTVAKRSLVVSMAAALLLAACGGSPAPAPAPQNKIVGTWDADVRAMMTASMPAGQAMSADMEAMIKDAYMAVEFAPDGTNTMTSKMGGDEKKETGKWEFVSQDGNTYHLKLTSQTGEGDTKTDNGTAVFTDDDHVKITIDGEGPGAPPLGTSRAGSSRRSACPGLLELAGASPAT